MSLLSLLLLFCSCPLFWSVCSGRAAAIFVLVAVVARDQPHLPKYSTRAPALTQAQKGGFANTTRSVCKFFAILHGISTALKINDRRLSFCLSACHAHNNNNFRRGDKNVYYDAFACRSGHLFAVKVFPRMICMHIQYKYSSYYIVYHI